MNWAGRRSVGWQKSLISKSGQTVGRWIVGRRIAVVPLIRRFILNWKGDLYLDVVQQRWTALLKNSKIFLNQVSILGMKQKVLGLI
jgi:hypothetical protein